MEDEEKKLVCSRCGYTALGEFVGDICPGCRLPYWEYANCGFTITAAAPPDVCPEWEEKCDFLDVTDYTGEHGGPDHTDPRLYRRKRIEPEKL